MLTRLLSLILLFSASAPAFAQRPDGELEILFVSSGNSLIIEKDKNILVEALKEIGYKVAFRTVPLARGLEEIKKANVDGELVRIREYGDSHPELVRVEEPFALAYFSVYSKQSSKVPCTWEELINSKLRIDFQRGIYYFEKMLRPHLSERIQAVDTPVQMFQRLRGNRSDLFLLDKITADREFAASKEKWDATWKCDILVAPTYMYLKKKHAGIALKLAPVLRKLKKQSEPLEIK